MHSRYIPCSIAAGMVAAFFVPVSAGPLPLPDECGKGMRVLCLSVAPEVPAMLGEEFVPRYTEELALGLKQIGYCLTTHRCEDSASADIGRSILLVSVEKSSSGRRMVIGYIRNGGLDDNAIAQALSHPLTELDLTMEDAGALTAVAVGKTIENLRLSHVCHVAIDSDPQGVRIESESGLEGVTPLEWIVPPGSLAIKAEMKGFMGVRRRLNLEKAGYHSYFFALRQRRFYHSKLMYPAVVCAVVAGGCFGLERYYYDKYHDLGEQDYYSRPEAFAQRFNMARFFERCAVGAAACASAALVFSFWF